MSARVSYTKVELNHSAIRAIKDRSKSELQTWSRSVLTQKVEPVTPIDMGALRRSGDVSVEAGNQIKIMWYWTVPYAAEVEHMRERGKAPRAPGTIAPFAEPTIRKAIEDEIAGPIGKAFGG